MRLRIKPAMTQSVDKKNHGNQKKHINHGFDKKKCTFAKNKNKIYAKYKK
jgi:hypothetical protein